MAKLAPPPSSADIMVEMIKQDPSRISTIANSADPDQEFEKLAAEAKNAEADEVKAYQAAYLTDKSIYRFAVWVLGAIAIIAIAAAILLPAFGLEIPESVIALGSAATGALVGLFADTPTATPG